VIKNICSLTSRRRCGGVW